MNLPKDGGCKYPIGDPRDKNFCFCNKPRPLTTPYCDEHADICYVEKANPEKRQRAINMVSKRNW